MSRKAGAIESATFPPLEFLDACVGQGIAPRGRQPFISLAAQVTLARQRANLGGLIHGQAFEIAHAVGVALAGGNLLIARETGVHGRVADMGDPSPRGASAVSTARQKAGARVGRRVEKGAPFVRVALLAVFVGLADGTAVGVGALAGALRGRVPLGANELSLWAVEGCAIRVFGAGRGADVVADAGVHAV